MNTPEGQQTSTKRVRDAVIVDATGHMIISVWEKLMDDLQDKNTYKLTNVAPRFFFGQRLATTENSMAIEDVDSNTRTLDWLSILNTVRQENSLQIDRKICCADIMNCKINIHLLCTNKKCGRRVTQLLGETTVQCAYCQRTMLIERCIYGLNGEITVEEIRNKLILLFSVNS